MVNTCIYMDVCCFNRPFDDQRQERIRLESEAILLILVGCQEGRYELWGSEAIQAEIEQTLDAERRQRLEALASVATGFIGVDERVERRGADLMVQGFTPFDALHLACAEVQEAVLLTTDDRMLRRASRLRDVLQVGVMNPVSWLLEVASDADE